jgi:hypothetical protein
MSAREAISADQVSSRGNVSLRKNHGAQLGEDHHNAPHPLHRGKITCEILIERFGCFYAESAWLPLDNNGHGGEGFIVWVGDPPQAGKACGNLQSAFAEAAIAAGCRVHDGRGNHRKDVEDGSRLGDSRVSGHRGWRREVNSAPRHDKKATPAID